MEHTKVDVFHPPLNEINQKREDTKQRVVVLNAATRGRERRCFPLLSILLGYFAIWNETVMFVITVKSTAAF